jgi:hypothetical protein
MLLTPSLPRLSECDKDAVSFCNQHEIYRAEPAQVVYSRFSCFRRASGANFAGVRRASGHSSTSGASFDHPLSYLSSPFVSQSRVEASDAGHIAEETSQRH